MIVFLVFKQNEFLEVYQHMPGAFVKKIEMSDVNEHNVIK